MSDSGGWVRVGGRRKRHYPGHCCGVESSVLGSLENHIESLSKAAYLENKKPELVSTAFTPPGLTHSPRGASTRPAVGSPRARECPGEEEGRWRRHASWRWDAENKSIIVHYYNNSLIMSCALIGNVMLSSVHQRLRGCFTWLKQIA